MPRYIEETEIYKLVEPSGIAKVHCVQIDELPRADVVPKSEAEKLVQDGTRLVQENETLKDNNEHLAVMLEETKIELKAMRGAANSLKMHYEKAEAEIERLRNILLQFTDIVHKWGAKNNIDTSEISLVPILQEEADSIIKKANQELASEIFAEIENNLSQITRQSSVTRMIAELKKKYTEDKE